MKTLSVTNTVFTDLVKLMVEAGYSEVSATSLVYFAVEIEGVKKSDPHALDLVSRAIVEVTEKMAI